MQITNIPAKFPMPFAAGAGSSYIRSIPTASQIGPSPGAASLTDGFPPLNFVPAAGGGIPPFGQDMNGILNWVSAWAQWQGTGSPVRYDAAFATAIGGYPAGALLNRTGGILGSVGYWYSTVDNNMTNPDAGGANWQAVAFGTTYAGDPNGHVAGIAAGDSGITQSLCWDTANLALWICTHSGTATGAIWASVTGTVTAVGVSPTNGFTGSSTGGTHPILTLGVTKSGMLKGLGGTLDAAVVDVDYIAPSSFNARSLTADGWQKLPGGLIMQWGHTGGVSLGGGPVNVTFPTPFLSACFGVTLGANAAEGVMVTAESVTATHFAYSAFASNTARIAGVGAWYQAMGI